jgi:hypothetical protein
MKLLRNAYIKIRNRLTLWNNQRRDFIRLEIRNKIPRLVVHEKYENTIKWILRILTIIGILSSIITFQWYLGLILSIFLSLIEQLLEKIVFMFTTLFIQPIPNWDSKEWLGMIFGIPLKRNIYKLGMLFKSENYAKEIFKCIRAWNYNQDEDLNNNINISFIIESNSEYSAYVYPSLERKSIELAKEKLEKEMLEKRVFKEHQQLIMTIIICKLFPNPPNSNFNLFKSYYKMGDSFEFGAYFIKSQIPELKNGKPITVKEGQIGQIHDINPVLKFQLKIKNRNELTEKDIEYSHGRLVMDK